MMGYDPISNSLHKVPYSQHLNSGYSFGLGFHKGRHKQNGRVGTGSGKEPEILQCSPFLPPCAEP